jgi:peptidyl-prolyl cis-trans isomerase C
LNAPNKFVIAFVALIVLGALAFLSFRSPSLSSGTSIGLSQDELNLLADKQLGARDKFELASNPEGRKEFVNEVRQAFALANEALRRRLKEPAHVDVLMDLGQVVALRQEYLERHAADPQGAGAQATPEQVDEWVAKHEAEIEKIKAAIKTGDSQPPVEGKQIASLYLVAEKAKAEGLDQDAEVKKGLVLQGKLIAVNILAGAAQEKLKDETTYSDADVTSYYNSKAPLGELDVVHAAHILFPTRSLPSPMGGPPAPVDPAAALALANDVLARVRAGEDFAELAKQYSGDPGSKQQGGDLGTQPLFSYVPEFSEAAAKLKPGEISDVVKSDFGYHVIKLIERQPPPPLTPQLSAQLKEQLGQQALKRKLDEIVRDYPPDVPEDFTVVAPAEMPPETPELPFAPEDMGPAPDEGDEGDEEEGPSAAPPSDAKKPGAKGADAAPKTPAKPAPGAKGPAPKPAGKTQ